MEIVVSQWLSKRRDQLHIVNEILNVAKRGASKTCIMHGVNLSFKGVNQYLNFMMENKLLLKTRENRKTVCQTKERGEN